MVDKTLKNNLNDDHHKRGVIPLLWCFICAFASITICSRSSFLYAFNLWDDANSYFTVGKCIFRGFVPYRDLFDQKGIMLYFIYGIGSLISATTFRGVYIMELIAAFFSLLAAFRISELFLKKSISSYVITALSGALIYSSANFHWGGSAEEFLFPAIMWGMYLSLRYFRCTYPAPMDYRTVLFGGLLAGCVLNIKFNSLGFFFAWMAMVFFADLIGSREIAKAFISCVVFLLGMGLSTLPWILYFSANGAVRDWLYVYIYKNVFEYSKSFTPGERAHLIYEIIKNHALNNRAVFGLIFLAVLYFLISAVISLVQNKENMDKNMGPFLSIKVMELINIGMLLFFLVLVIFIGGVSLPYYSFSMNGFVLFGLVSCVSVCEWLIERIGTKKDENISPIGKTATVIAAALSLVVAVVLSGFLSVNVKSMHLTEDDLWIFKFRDYIEASGVENPGLINEFAFDTGLYTVLDIEPICYYFQTQTLNMDEVLDYQKQYLHSGEADFVVSVDTQAEGTGDRYDLVMKERCTFYNFDRTYYLYERNDNPATE